MEKERVLFLTKKQQQTGNNVTFERVKSYFQDQETILCNNVDEKISLVEIEEFKASFFFFFFFFGIHLFKSGRILKQFDFPFCLVVGGTDINVDAVCQEKMKGFVYCTFDDCLCGCFSLLYNILTISYNE